MAPHTIPAVAMPLFEPCLNATIPKTIPKIPRIIPNIKNEQIPHTRAAIANPCPGLDVDVGCD